MEIGPRTLEEKLSDPQIGDNFDTYCNGTVTVIGLEGDVVTVRLQQGTTQEFSVEGFAEFFRADAEAYQAPIGGLRPQDDPNL